MLLQRKYFFLVLLISVNLFPQAVSRIDITGERAFSKSDYQQWCGFQKGVKYFAGMEDSLKANIAFNLGSSGYFNSIINVVKEKGDTTDIILSIKIDEGKPSYIKKINFSNSDSADVSRFSPYFLFLEKGVFESAALEKTFSKILNELENNGYPFAKISIISLVFTDDSTDEKHYVEIFISINKELAGIINKIEIKGNKKTNDNVIIRSAGFETGELYSQKKVDEVPEKLNRLRFFEPVKPASFYINSKKEGILSIDVKEKETNSFDGIIGYMPGDSKQSGYITGLVNISFRNLFGTGRGIAVNWQKPERLSQELELKYLEPWLIGLPVNFNLGYYQKKQDSTYIQKKYDFSLEYLTTDELSASILLGLESVVPIDNGSQLFTVYNSSLVTTGVSVKIDSRDDPYSPQKGIYFLNTYAYSQKKINGPEQFLTPSVEKNIALKRIKVDLNLYHSFFERQVAALGIHGRELQGKTFETSDLYLLGGTNTLRGYKENQFSGSRVLWSNLEYRFLMSQRSFAFLFYDAGYYLRKAEPERNILELSGYKTGYGLGLNLETGLGVMTVSFALAKGDSFSQGKIHFGLVNDF
jgi:outer membrane protein insertion porin family